MKLLHLLCYVSVVSLSLNVNNVANSKRCSQLVSANYSKIGTILDIFSLYMIYMYVPMSSYTFYKTTLSLSFRRLSKNYVSTCISNHDVGKGILPAS